ncbi:12393_t:CDS:2 [Acaulospora morrowiae]|uniref:12393_t:CDS:1 n=1 Tax=Acaulospora morrowiae TaxID=94023 RepID=A0A9N8VCV3_9GLOM|nr:12393_t:CDS:2 [Acaulospora morrowiae]
MSNLYSSPLENTPNAREYIDIMVEIRKFTSDLEEYTPIIVAFGDQSSGKSSLMQRLTGGIPVPRGSGRCTTTPFEIRMLQSETPKSKISLRYVEDSLQTRVPSREVEFADILGLSNPEVEAKLREAQRYLQNPSIRDVHTTSLPTDDSDELKFTRNTVCVTIEHPKIEYSLDMVDLPGIVRDNEANEKFVVSLVREYIAKENTILLPIFASNVDIATQSAWRLAREADPMGLRTVGIITKIDQILDYTYHEDRHKELASLVSGRGEHTIKNGMFIIRNPSDAASDRAVSPGDLEVAAIDSLLQNRIWRNVPRNRFGLPNLIMKLSELQKVLQEKTWPRIKLFLERRKSELEDKLQLLPPPPDGNPVKRFMELISKFDKEFSSQTNTDHLEPRLYRGQQWNFGQFDVALLNTRPIYNFSFIGSYSTETFDPIKPGALQYSEWTENMRREIEAEEWGSSFHQDNHQYTWDLEKLCEVVQRAHGGQLVGYFPYKAVVNIVEKHKKDWFKISQKLLYKNYEWVANFTDELVEETFKEFSNAIKKIKEVLRELLKKYKDETLGHLEHFKNMESMSANRSLYTTDEATLIKKQKKYHMQLRVLCATSAQDQEQSRKILAAISGLLEMMQDNNTPAESLELTKNYLIEEIRKTGSLDSASQQLIEEVKSARIGGENVSTATLSMIHAVKNSYVDKMIGIVPRTTDHEENKAILNNNTNEQAFLAATGALAYWKMLHSRFRETIPRVVEYYLVYRFAGDLGNYLRECFSAAPEIESDSDMFDRNRSMDLNELLGEDPENAIKRRKWMDDLDTLNRIIDKIGRIGRCD